MYTTWLGENCIADESLYGMKGAVLIKLAKKNFLVPEGFLITSEACAKTIKENKIEKELANVQQHSAKLSEEEQIKKMKFVYQGINLPPSLADDLIKVYEQFKEKTNEAVVRCSPLNDYSFGGGTAVFNITRANLFTEAVRISWSLLGKKQDFKNKIFDHTPFALIVQAFIDAEISGILYTENPLNNNSEEILIEAVYGLSEGITTAIVKCDTYVVSRRNLKVSQKEITQKKQKFVPDNDRLSLKTVSPNLQCRQCLAIPHLSKLVSLGLEIEKSLGSQPQKIEWVLKDGSFYIINASPLGKLPQ